jgi:hypothetical protein
MRIIGVELRLRFVSPRMGSQQKEIAIIPCHVDIELETGNSPEAAFYNSIPMNETLHTDFGDINIPEFSIPDYMVGPQPKSALRTQQKS